MTIVVAIVGYSGSGKTTLIEKLIPELVGRGLKVASIKHTHHDLKLQKPNSDTDRHFQAGTTRTALSGKGFLSVQSSEELPVADLIELLGKGCDLVILEGYKNSCYPKVEVLRGQQPALSADEVWLTATDRTIGRTNEVPLTEIDLLVEQLTQFVRNPDLKA